MNGPYSEIGKGRVIGEYGWHKEADGVVRAALLEVCKDFPDDEAMRLYWADYLLSRLAELYPEIIWRWPSTNSAGLQRTVRFSRYAWSMGTQAAKNILLATLALALGLALRAVTELGFGYDLAANAAPSKIVATK